MGQAVTFATLILPFPIRSDLSASVFHSSTQGAELRKKWSLQTDPPICKHLSLELEWDDSGYSTECYICILCGERVCEITRKP